MSDQGAISADLPSAVNEGFTEGGDLAIQSTDGVNFSVHSILLSLASPVFSELLKTGNRDEIIRFSENSEVLALMLNFIYPRPTPTIPTMDLLNHAMRVANKYQLESMKTRLREQLVLVDSPVSVYSNAFGALCIASSYGFTAEAELAADLASKQCDFGKIEDLKKLIEATPGPATASLVKLTGIPLIKTRVLVDVLFHFERPPMSLNNNIEAFICQNCRGSFRGYSRQSPPEWQARWAHWIYEKIKDRPISEWKEIFNPLNISRAFSHSHLSLNIYSYASNSDNKPCTCLNVISDRTNATAVQTWVNGVYEHLKSRFSVIAELEVPQSHKPRAKK
ncbi:hypothetical protein FRC11_014084 [Ceratobasidium sp. 423]|nr:hypothetical protein FRC11_014084 [Ceratobasidium sp. 423]